jgi:hypothetical protein
MTKLNLFTNFACVAAAAIGAAQVKAADFPRTTAAAQLSMSRGFKATSLSLLNRTSGVGAQAVNAALLQKLCSGDCSSVNTEVLADKVQTTGDHWQIEVLGDGTAARFRDLEVEGRAHALGKEPSLKMPAETMEQAGRAFISSKLSQVITLAAGEELVPVRTDYLIEGGQDLQTKQITRAVVSNRIVFGRAIHGIPVVGGGSTVVLTFTNDGAVESFQYDWPSYQAAATRNVVDSSELLHRVQQVVGARTGVSSNLPLITPNTRTASPIAVAQNTTLQKMECGYYDPGAGVRDEHAPVQAGCVYHAMEQGQNGIRRGFAGAIPAAQQIEPDDAWTEARIIQGMGAADSQQVIPQNSNSQ